MQHILQRQFLDVNKIPNSKKSLCTSGFLLKVPQHNSGQSKTVSLTNLIYHILERIIPIPMSPTEVVQMAVYMLESNTAHSLQFSFGPAPDI